MPDSYAMLDRVSNFLDRIPGWAPWTVLAIAAVLILVFGAFYVTAFMEAYLEVKNKPREKMGWCYKHGFIRERHMLPLGFMDVCPICYKKSLDQGSEIKS